MQPDHELAGRSPSRRRWHVTALSFVPLLAWWLLAAAVAGQEPGPKEEPGAAPPAAEAKPAAAPAPAEAAPAKAPVSFPVKSDALSDVSDGQDDPENAMVVEMSALADIIVALQNTSDEELAKHLDPKITYAHLMKYPGRYRGQVVQLRGRLRQVDQKELKPNKSGVTKVWHCYLSDALAHITNVLCLEGPPAGMELASPAQATGIFLKRYAYENKMSGEKTVLTWGPMLVVRRLAPYDVMAEEYDISRKMNHPVAIAIFLLIGLCLAGYVYFWIRGRYAKANIFAQRRIEKEGEGLFPRKPRPPQRPKG